MNIFIDENLGSVRSILNESQNPEYILILTHGSGAGMDHPFMEDLATAIANLNGNVLRFNFPYMDAGKKVPGSPKVSQQSIISAIDHIHKKYWNLPVFLSGKSYGGRMCSHVVADEMTSIVSGLVYFGFPLHAPGRDGVERAKHLQKIKIPQLFLQGTNDKLANIDLIKSVVNEQKVGELHTLKHADHSFGVPKKLGKTREDILAELAKEANQWILSCKQ